MYRRIMKLVLFTVLLAAGGSGHKGVHECSQTEKVKRNSRSLKLQIDSKMSNGCETKT